jgi:hypothetical protein
MAKSYYSIKGALRLMFGLSTMWIKGLVLAGVVTVISSTVYGGYRIYTNMQAEISQLTINNATLTSNNATLNQGITDQQIAIASLEADITLQTTVIADTNSQFTVARDQVSDLRDRLARHELAFLAASKPGLVTNVINNATNSAGRCLEIVSGSPLTLAEQNATLPSEINTECPTLANPNYEAD